MNDSKEPRRRYKWPWVVAAAVALSIILAVVWMCAAVKTVEEERNFDTPSPAGAASHPN